MFSNLFSRAQTSVVSADYRRDLRRIISDVMIQTLQNAMATSNTSTSKFPLDTFNNGILLR
jgi:hypothetical protein